MQAPPLTAELEAALTSDATRRIEMLTRIAELFVGGASRYSEEQIRLFDDIMVRLVGTVDANTRAKLAQRLAPIANAPSNLIHRLAFDDDIEVARPILSQSERLEDAALRANAATKSHLHRLAIAGRRSLSEAVTDALVERGDREVLRAVVNNAGSRFSEAGLRRLAAEKAPARSAMEDIAATGAPGTAAPHFAAIPASHDRREPVDEVELYRYARDRKFEEAALALSALCDSPIDLVERALLDPTAEIILILAKVAGLSAATTKALLLLRGADRAMSATDLDHALLSFERLQPAAARRVLDFFRTRLKKPAQPVMSRAAAVTL